MFTSTVSLPFLPGGGPGILPLGEEASRESWMRSWCHLNQHLLSNVAPR
jgi:hypothetical protein